MNLQKKINRKKLILSILAGIVFGVSFNACNEQPVELGYSLLSDTISVNAINTSDYNLVSSTVAGKAHVSNWNIGSILLGNYSGPEGDTKAVYVSRFYFPEGIETINKDDIVSAKLLMYPQRYSYGDSLSTVSFRAYQINANWQEFEWEDFFPGGNLLSSPIVDYGKELCSWAGNIAYKDSVDMETISIDFDYDVLIKWHKLQLQWDSAFYELQTDSVYLALSDSLQEIRATEELEEFAEWGIALIPDGNFGIRQFRTDSVGVTMDQWGKRIDTVDHTKIEFVVRKYDTSDVEYLDTIFVIPGLDGTFVDAPPAPANRIVVQPMVMNYGDLFFDFSEIPATASINSAILELSVDKENTYYGNYGPDSTMLLRYQAYDIDEDQSYRSHYGRLDAEEKWIYRFSSIASDVERILRNPGSDSSSHYLHVIPESFGDALQIDRTTFYGQSDPDPEKRPKLHIIYTTRPEIHK